MVPMKLLRGIQLSRRKKLVLATIACLFVVGIAWAGWQIQRATDVTLVDPIALPDDVELRSGDIIVAGGVSLQSRFVMSFTEDNHYSHVGLIEATPQGLFVIHAAPSGEGDGGVGDQVARIPLSLFLAERGYVAVRVMRLKGEALEAMQLARDACEYASVCVEQAIPFDSAFDLSEKQTMYCSELVYLAYQHAGFDWPDTLIRSVSTLIVEGPVILPDAFTRCEALETVWQHSSEREKS